MSADSIEKIADEILDLISRCPDELTASVVLANIRRKAYTLRALPSLAELERDAGKDAASSIDYWQKRGHVCKTCGGHGVIRGGSPLHHLGTWADKCTDCDGTNIWDARAGEAKR